MIRFLITRGHDYTLKCARKERQAPPIRIMTYDRLLRSRRLPAGAYIFSDLDRLGFWDLELAAHAYLEMKNAGMKVWNNPARVKNRYALLRALHAAGLNDFNIYRADNLDGGIRFPVFLRKAQGHGAPLSDLLHDRAAVETAIEHAVAEGTPLEHLVVIEFAAEPIRPGLYRKLSAFRIGQAIVPHISVHDAVWLVKYGKHGIASEEVYEEESSLLERQPYSEHLAKVFEIAGIEYGRADFGIYKGRVQVYEINTNPAVCRPIPHPSPTRVQSMRWCWEKYLEALGALDVADGVAIALSNGSLQRNRVWSNLLVRTRKPS
ncbi:MAG TPA: hypothetical protein VHH88_07650 [Verrucomicrobiae bacterium]|nr:hypothetical protein [Verrucomicrobiae bacterium]